MRSFAGHENSEVVASGRNLVGTIIMMPSGSSCSRPRA